MAHWTDEEVEAFAAKARQLDSATVLLHEYRATHDETFRDGHAAGDLCECDTCTKATTIIGERAG